MARGLNVSGLLGCRLQVQPFFYLVFPWFSKPGLQNFPSHKSHSTGAEGLRLGCGQCTQGSVCISLVIFLCLYITRARAKDTPPINKQTRSRFPKVFLSPNPFFKVNPQTSPPKPMDCRSRVSVAPIMMIMITDGGEDDPVVLGKNLETTINSGPSTSSPSLSQEHSKPLFSFT